MNNITQAIQCRLFGFLDSDYKKFTQRLIPTVDKDKFIGVRMPCIKKIARELYNNGDYIEFIEDLPHKYHEENLIHAAIIPLIKDKHDAILAVQRFLPYVDNWAVCDSISLKVNNTYQDKLYSYIKNWITSSHPYTVRFAVKMLMDNFLGDNYRYEYSELVISVCSEEYYVNMMRAWYFATALFKQYNSIIPILENKLLDKWTHNKAIQKAIESYKITPTQKEYLRFLRK